GAHVVRVLAPGFHSWSQSVTISGATSISANMVAEVAAQGGFAMTDPKQMAGIPRPVDDLPNGAISVRLIRGGLSNNIANHPVELRIGSKVLTVKTDESGRAQFNDVTPDATVKASADVDGEHLESQEFRAPERGGIRLMLVATDRSKGPSADAGSRTCVESPRPAPAISGVIVGELLRVSKARFEERQY